MSENGQVARDVTGDGRVDHVIVVGCIEPFVGVPPGGEEHVVVYDDAGHLEGSAFVTSGTARLSDTATGVRIERTWCDDSVLRCITSGADAVTVTWHANAPLIVRLPAADTFSDRELRLGDEGFDVLAMQGELTLRGANIEADGRFGPRTEAALKEAQTEAGLSADGLAGANTRAALGIGRQSDTTFANEEEFLTALLNYLRGQDVGGLPGDAVRLLEPRRSADPSLIWQEFNRTQGSNGRVLVEVSVREAGPIADSLRNFKYCVLTGANPRWCGLWYDSAGPSQHAGEVEAGGADAGGGSPASGDSRAVIDEYLRRGAADDCDGAWALLADTERADYVGGFGEFCGFWQRVGAASAESCDAEGDAFVITCIVAYELPAKQRVSRERVLFEMAPQPDGTVLIGDYQYLAAV